jgi:tetratricopeptide (TPR) repeat protein
MPARKVRGVAFAAVMLLCAGCARWQQGGTVHEAGSDQRAQAFQRTWLPRMILDARDKFNADSVARDFSRLALDPTRLVLLEPSAVRVYFVGAQGGFKSALGYLAEGAQMTQSHPRALFSNATAPMKLFESADAMRQGTPPAQALYGKPRQRQAPMLPGDFVDLGTLPAGSRLIFYLDTDSANLANKGRFTTIPPRNPDKIEHVVTVAYQNSPYVLLGFEDLMGGGDRTFNDVVFAVELSDSTVAALGDKGNRVAVDDAIDRADRARIRRARLMVVASAALGVGGPLLGWLLLRWMRRRRVALACAAARKRLESGDARGALRRVREAQRRDGARALGGRLADIEMTACKQLRDAASMEDLFGRYPDMVLKDETASVMAARSQIETERTESFNTLRQAWQRQSDAPWTWTVLEADLLMGREKTVDAASLLRQQSFSGSCDAVRLARLAEALPAGAATEATAHLARALQLGPDEPEVHRSRARLLERAGRIDEAGEAWRAAAMRSGGDPFHLDHYAEHLVRRRDYAGALACWRDALAQPAADTLWLKAFFWERVAGPASISWKSLEMPPGPLRPLLERLLAMPEERFWQAGDLEPFVQSHPDFASRPECLWLRILYSLGGGQEEAALAMLSMSPTRFAPLL